MVAMINRSSPQFGQCSRSIAKTGLSSQAQPMRTGWPCAQPGSVAVAPDAPASLSDPYGTHQRGQLRVGRQHPMEAVRCSRGRGTGAARRCMNSSGDITMCVVPSRQGVLSLSTTCPAALHCTRSLASAARVMVPHSCSSRWRSWAAQRTAACRLKP